MHSKYSIEIDQAERESRGLPLDVFGQAAFDEFGVVGGEAVG